MTLKAQIECPSCGMNTAEEREDGSLYCKACNSLHERGRTEHGDLAPYPDCEYDDWCGRDDCPGCQGYDTAPWNAE